MTENMTQDQRLTWLVEAFKADSGEYRDLETPKDAEGRRRVLRSLMNIRMPRPLPLEALAVQDDYLRQRAAEKGVVGLRDIPVVRGGISLWQGDITRLAVDAIVNAANSQMLGCFVPMHSCIDNCIHTFAGVQLRAECARQMNRLRAQHGPDYEQPTAVPMLTDGYNLPAKKVIHIVGAHRGEALPDGGAETGHWQLQKHPGGAGRTACAASPSVCTPPGCFRFPGRRGPRGRELEAGLARQRPPPGAMDRVIFNVFKDEEQGILRGIIEKMV